MDKQDNISNYNHGISLLERKNLVVTGIKKIENFDNEQFLLETVMGFIIIKGENLELIKLDPVCLNYVIFHELCHLKHPNHSKDFWREVEIYVPDYKIIKKMMKNV